MLSSERVYINQTPQYGQDMVKTSNKRKCTKNRNTIPIMFKSYPNGKFSHTIVKGPVTKLVISESKG
jgi:hypothetical protein